MTTDVLEQARAYYDAGEFDRCREAALSALEERPDDPELLRLAGKSSAELGFDDAPDYLQQAVTLEPDNVDAWR